MKNSKVVFVAIVLSGLLMSSCTKDQFIVVGTGSLTTETLSVAPFSKIIMSGSEKVFISYGSEQEVTVTGHSNIIDRIRREVADGTWDMGLERGQYLNADLIFNITLPAIESITTSGTSTIEVLDFIKQKDFSLSIDGSGRFNGFKLPTENCSISIKGTGRCEVSVENRLDVVIEGTGHVYYNGDPLVTRQIKGDGSVIRQGD